MRLDVLENGHTLLQKIQLRVIRAIAGRKVGPILVMSYRRDLFGKHLAASFQEAMRETSEWTVGEVELFAAFVSNLNQCRY